MGCKTLHPLVSVVDLSEANLEQRTIRCDFYTIILIEGEAGNLCTDANTTTIPTPH